ncbi:MAG: T9SS type A sorting domain-containing protein [Flavobacteriales bacterium]
MKSFFTATLIFLLSLSSYAQSIGSTEAIEYDPTGNRWLITNGSSILQQPSGTDDLEFFGSSGASYGMEVMNDKLFAIGGTVKAFDLDTEDQVMNTSISGAGFLNGMASDGANNRIWITDFSNNRIYELDVADLDNPVSSMVVSNTGCTPNGITYDEANNRLVFTCWSGGDIKAVDLTDYSVSTLIDTGLNSIDGIDHDEDGNFYISSWSPTRITLLAEDFTVQETVTATGLSGPADISYAVQIDSLGIANSGNGSVTYIYFGATDNIKIIEASNSLAIYPNPITENSYVSFSLAQASECHLAIYSLEGKLVYELLNEKMAAGEHKVLMSGITLEKASYICKLKTNAGISTIQLIY